MDVEEVEYNIENYNLAVDESGVPVMQDAKLVLVSPSGEFIAVDNCAAIRNFYRIDYLTSTQQTSNPTHPRTTSPAIEPQQPNTPQPSITQQHLVNPELSITPQFHNIAQPMVTPQPSITPQSFNTQNSLITSQSPDNSQPSITSHSTVTSQVTQSQQNKGQSRWTHSATLQLIEEWRRRRDRFDNNYERNELVWDELTRELNRQGYCFTTQQIESKFKYLKKIYIKCIDHNKSSTGEAEQFCNYYDELHDLFGRSPQIQPPALVASRSLQQPQDVNEEQLEAAQEAVESGSSANDSSTHAPRVVTRQTRMQRVVGRWAEEFRNEARQREEARTRRHEELMRVLRESNDRYEKLMERLIDKL